MNNFDFEADFAAAAAGVAGTVLVLWLIALAAGILMIIAQWRIFSKAGEPGWASLIPIYNLYVLYKITWGSGIRFLLLLIPLYNIILAIQTNIRLARAFGKDDGFAVGLIFLPSIFMLILGFGGAQYCGVPGVYQQPYGQPQQPYGQPQQPNAQQWTYNVQQQPQQQTYAQPQQQTYAQPQQQTYTQPQQQPSGQPQQQPQQPAFCPNCGQALDPNVKFCPGCGQPTGKA